MSESTKYENKLEEIRKEVEIANWRYLRENNKRYFLKTRKTSLQDYLEYIFPDITEWNCNKPISAKDQRELASKEPTDIRRYRPDAFSKELKLVVEFDGKPHYQNPTAIINDKKER